MVRRFEEIRFQRIHELAQLIEKYKVIPVDVLEGYVGVKWGLRPEPLHKMLEQLEKARLIEINEGKAKWLGKGLEFEEGAEK